MRVAMVVPFYFPYIGGLQSHVEMLSESLVERGAQVTVLTQEVNRRLARRDALGRTEVLRFMTTVPSRRYPVALGLTAHLRRTPYDVVHLHSYHGAASISGLFVPRPTPVVFTPHYHGGGHTAMTRRLHKLYRPLGRRIMARSDAVIAVSHAEAELLGSHFPQASGRVTVIPNGVRVRAAQEERAPVPELLTIARLESYKRLDRVLEVAAALPPEWRLHFIGTGPEEDSLRATARQLGLGDRLRISSGLSDAEMGSALARAWAYISLSEKEAFGLTVLEAAAAGMPAVVSDIPAHRELAAMAPGSVFVASATDEPSRIAELILAHLDARPDRGWIGSVAWAEVGERTLDLYRRLHSAAPSAL